MNYMIQDLLDFAQIKAGKFRKNISMFDIRESVEKVMCIQRKKAEEKNIQFEVIYNNVDDNQDEAAKLKNCMVRTDEQRVMQVLLGLQSNALKFTTSGSVTIIVEIEKRDGSQYLKISVKDTGIGIPEKDKNKLFKLFGFVKDTQ